MTTNESNRTNDRPDGPVPADELDTLLRRWHRDNATRAQADRARLVRRLTPGATTASGAPAPAKKTGTITTRRWPGIPVRYRVAAALAVLVGLIVLLVPRPTGPAAAAAEHYLPEGGAIEAFDEDGQVIGPCPLTHTDVKVDVTGRFARVTLRQQFWNAYDETIEAVYTFPLSHRGAVDRMSMRVGDRVIVGEVKERREARQVYESARAAGHVASLLEQERPNIFTQSVANIEAGASIDIEISYVETIEVIDGEHRFDFPMVVAPRYIPGKPTGGPSYLPEELTSRRGIVLRGPVRLTGLQTSVDTDANADTDADTDPDPDTGTDPDTDTDADPGTVTDADADADTDTDTDTDTDAVTDADPDPAPDAAPAPELLTPARLHAWLNTAAPIQLPGSTWWGAEAPRPEDLWCVFEVTYADDARERGTLFVDGTGELAGRWFFVDRATPPSAGGGFSADTDQVPDASRVTPMPVRPDRRAGHDIAIAVTIDGGGTPIVECTSELHAVERAGTPQRARVTLARQREIPNRDFILRWRLQDDAIETATFAHRDPAGAPDGTDDGFFTLMLAPPARVTPDAIPPRELVFVLDCSGSMKEFPIEKAKSIVTKAVEAMQPEDRFTVVTFNNTSEVLWEDL
ncbi:MAG: VWA domain-containing protein, partial [Phycisphaerales bacterium]|nr:VWA domain-containing protein [Phycisphaerales bacterium]